MIYLRDHLLFSCRSIFLKLFLVFSSYFHYNKSVHKKGTTRTSYVVPYTLIMQKFRIPFDNPPFFCAY